MTPEQMREMVEGSGLSQQAWARSLKVSPQTFRRWLAGEKMPYGYVLAMQYLDEHSDELDRSTEGHKGGREAQKNVSRVAKHK